MRILIASLVGTGLMLVPACIDRSIMHSTGAPRDSFTAGRFTVVIDGASDSLEGAAVTPEFFSTEGVQPMLGRLFIAPEYGSATAAVAVLSHGYWVDRFRSAPTAIGTSIEVDGRSRVIVGVTPPAFRPDGAGRLWIPKGG